jgi:hypothetical protein
MSTLIIQTVATLSVNRHRVIAAVLFVLGGTLLGLAMYLSPSNAGLGTHQQLGLPACSMYLMSGRPCPSCGMTTAFSHMMHAQPLASFRAQPFGALLCLIVIAATLTSGYVLITGRNVWPQVRQRLTWQLWLALAAAFIGSWLYKLNTM